MTTDIRKQVNTKNGSLVGNATITSFYCEQLTKMAKNRSVLKEIIIWIHNVVIKFSSCLNLTIISSQLRQVLVKTKRRKRRYKNIRIKNLKRKRDLRFVNRNKQPDENMKTLIVVLSLFLLTDLPQGILGFLTTMQHGRELYQSCCLMLDAVSDILSLVNSAVSVSLYCAIDNKFKATFSKFVCRKQQETPTNTRPKQVVAQITRNFNETSV
ncbi:unnamed protein product [Xylocopa violacea]|uniref:G-protein coupled receptors family 1 profile domain-containing protein n=1 Tax=Xylocopa violacea TaxID=135666 RepID=A0ABP1P7N2_XYLVO